MHVDMNDLVAAKTDDGKWDIFMVTEMDVVSGRVGYHSAQKDEKITYWYKDVRVLAPWRFGDEDA